MAVRLYKTRKLTSRYVPLRFAFGGAATCVCAVPRSRCRVPVARTPVTALRTAQRGAGPAPGRSPRARGAAGPLAVDAFVRGPAVSALKRIEESYVLKIVSSIASKISLSLHTLCSLHPEERGRDTENHVYS